MSINAVHPKDGMRRLQMETTLAVPADDHRCPVIELKRTGMPKLAPRDVDQLFAEAPGLFAYTLPSIVERASLSVGDKVKLFFDVKGRLHPRAKWFVVIGKSETEEGVLQPDCPMGTGGSFRRSLVKSTLVFPISTDYL